MDDTLAITTARQQWAQGTRLLEQLRAEDPFAAARCDRVVDGILDELARQVGQVFTILELAHAYRRAEDWAAAIAHRLAADAPVAWQLSLVQDAAFDRYARGARDYEP